MKSMKEKNNINRKLSWLKLVSWNTCIFDLRKPWQAWSVMAIWEGPMLSGWES